MSRDLISPEGLRADGRRAHELRRIDIRLGADAREGALGGNEAGGSAAAAGAAFESSFTVATSASSSASSLSPLIDGLASYSCGHTSVSACVVGPCEVESRMRHHAKADRAIVTVELVNASFSGRERKKATKTDRRSAELCVLLRQSFESVILTHLYPGCQISLYVTVLHNDGGVLAASINAITLALQNAGIAMIDMLCACTVGLADNKPVIDLNLSERSSETPELILASLAHSGDVVLIQQESKMNFEALQDMIRMALEGNQTIYLTAKNETQRYSEAILRSRGIL